MQLLIDTATETLNGLRMAAYILEQTIAAHHGEDALIDGVHAAAPRPVKAPTPPPILPTPPSQTPAAPLPPGNVPPAPVEHPEYHPEGQPHVPAVPVQAPQNVPAGTIPDAPPPNLGFNPGATVPAAPAAPIAAATAPAVSNAGIAPAAPVTGTNGTPAPIALESVGERDSANIPWDDRIHSETRKKNADGTWRYRRNLDPNVKAVVLADLKALYGNQSQVPLSQQQPAAGVPSAVPVPPAPAGVPQPPAAAASVPVPPAPAAGAVPSPTVSLQPSNVLPFTGGAVPVPPSAAVGVPNAPQPGVLPAPVTSFRDLMQKVNVALSNGRLTQAQLTEACKAAGISDGSITALASQPMLVPAVDDYLNRLGVAA